MQMTVCPGHRDLNDVVQPVEFRVRSDDHTPPDRRLRPLERDLKLIEWDAAAGLNVRNALHEWHAMRCVAVGQLLSEPGCSPGFSRSQPRALRRSGKDFAEASGGMECLG